MGRRRRRVIRVVKKKLPTVFVCPRCGEEAVRVSIAKDTGKAVVLCAQCQLKDEFPAHPAAQMIDVYSYFTDRFYGVKDPRPIIPHEREAPRELGPPEELKAESPLTETAASEIVSEPQVTIEPAPEVAAESQPIAPEMEETSTETTVEATQRPAEEKPSEAQPPEGEATTEEESEPFADILQNKEKKRYSPNPLPQQPSE